MKEFNSIVMVQKVKMEKLFYLWNFGDGTTSTEVSPTHVYGEKGAYTVELTVKDSRGKESKEQTNKSYCKDPQTGIP